MWLAHVRFVFMYHWAPSSLHVFGFMRCDTPTDVTSRRSVTAALFVLIFFHLKPRLFMIFRGLVRQPGN
jgi:hypothetical protein